MYYKLYLTDHEFIEYETGKQTNTLTIKCGIPQGSMLGPPLILLYINVRTQASNIINPITSIDDIYRRTRFFGNK